MNARLAHALIAAASAPAYRRFARALREPERAQRAILTAIIGDESYERFRDRAPVTTYADYADSFERLRATDRSLRFQPTSGSTSSRKWIPYPRSFVRELDAAIAPWMFDLGRRHPGVRRGRHYWSLSWMPDELRAASNDDLELLPWTRRLLMRSTMAVPSSIVKTATSAEAMQATADALARCRDLTFISVWSPTFLLRLLQLIGEEPAKLWPDLAVISCWTTGASAKWAEELARACPQAAIEPKGLFATEGVVTIPFRERFPIAIRSHFYEFVCIGTSEIRASWQLEKGQRVKPLVTTSSGLRRYQLDDVLEVDGFIERTPSLQFLGRERGIDLVGEKLDNELVSAALAAVGAQWFTLFAVEEQKHYCLIAAADCDADGALQSIHHYRVAREIGQLGPARVVVCDDPVRFFDDYAAKCGILAGELKVEPLMMWRLPGSPSHGVLE